MPINKEINGANTNDFVTTNTSTDIRQNIVADSDKRVFLEDMFCRYPAYILLSLLLLLSGLVYGEYIFTDKVFLFKDIGSDTLNVYYPNFFWLAEYIENNLAVPSWSFATGLGQDVLLDSRKGDIFTWLLIWGGKDNLVNSIVFAEVLKIVLSGMIFYGYLKTFGLGSRASLIGGLIYPFCGFMMVGSGWYVFTSQGLYFAALLFAFERLLVCRNWVLFPVAIMFLAANQPFDIYTASILIASYGLVRILDVNKLNWRAVLKQSLILAGLTMLGIAMAAVVVMPSVYLMFNSPRGSGESSLTGHLLAQGFSLVNVDLWATTKARFFSNNLLNIGGVSQYRGAMNYLEAPALYCSLVSLILIPQFFAFSSKKKYVLYGSLLVLMFVPLVIPFFRYAFWLFTGDYFRLYSLFVIILLLLLTVKSIQLIFDQQRVSWGALAVGIATSLVLLISIENSATVVVDPAARTMAGIMIIGYATIIALWTLPSLKLYASAAFIALLFADIYNVAEPTLNNRFTSTEKEFTENRIGYNDYTADAVDYLKLIDTSFYRIEKFNYYSGLAMHGSMNDAKVQGYFSSRSYQSFNHINYIKFLDALNIINIANEAQTRWAPGVTGRPLLSTLVSTKYILSKSGSQQPVGAGYKFLKTIGDVSIFENQFFLPFGFTYNKVIKRSAFNVLNQALRQKDVTLIKAAVVDDANDEVLATIPLFDTNDIKSKQFSLAHLQQEVVERTTSSFDLESFNHNAFSGNINADTNKLLFFSMPFDESWKISINNQPAKLINLNAGLSGVLISKGLNSIKMEYHTPYAKAGLIISIIAFIIFGIGIWRYTPNIRQKTF